MQVLISLKALQWFNSVNGRQDKVDFSNEPLMCCFGDVHHSNFPVDVNRQLWVIDFEHVSVLPSSFMRYVLRAHGRGLRGPLIKDIPVPVSKNLPSMGNASYIFKCVANTFRKLKLFYYFIWSFNTDRIDLKISLQKIIQTSNQVISLISYSALVDSK